MDAAERDAWRQADDLFNQLVELPPTQRDARLAELEPGSMLRVFVERLLAADAADTGLLECPIPIALLPQAQGALTGRRLGRWRLLEEIGRGGMSVVYRAVADEGATGQVAAVKVLTLGALAEQGRERFLQEQRALLRLRHPYLATLYDAGVADDGTPWLAMALVEGRRIDQWCEDRALDVHARVRLVLQVCEALNYTHRSLVIHRDIKPSNVLVDEDGHVRLIDFGIARLIDGSAERTTTALRALTPEYAAPEQFAGASPSTMMDVYGLGALLYRILAERPPRPPVGHDGPPMQSPSSAVRGAAQLQALERRRRTRQLRGDRDTVVIKALAEKPEHRYASVEALAEDLKRWLSKRPIRARTATLPYRFAKLVSRHRWAALALVAFLAMATTAVVQIVEQRDLARVQADRAVTVRDFLANVFESTDPSVGEIPDVMDLLNAGSRRARDELIGVDPLVAADVLLISGGARNALNDYDQAESDLKLALSLLQRMRPAPARELSRVHWHLGALYKARGPMSAAVEHTGLAVHWVKRWEAPRDELLSREVSLAAVWAKTGRAADAEAMVRRVLADIATHDLANTQLHLDALNALTSMLAINGGSTEERLALHEQRLQAARNVYGENSGWYAYTLADLVPTLRKSPAHLDRAEAIAREAVAITSRIYDEPHMFTAVAECNLAALLVQRQRLVESLRHYDRSIVVDEALQRSDLHAQSCRYSRAEVRASLGDADGALADLAHDRSLLLKLGRERSTLWMKNCGLHADLLARSGRRGAASALLDACMADHHPAGERLPQQFLSARAAVASAGS